MRKIDAIGATGTGHVGRPPRLVRGSAAHAATTSVGNHTAEPSRRREAAS